MWLSVALVEKIIKLRLTKEKWSDLVDRGSDLVCSAMSGWCVWQNWWPLSWQHLTKLARLTKVVDMNWQNWWAMAKVGEVTKLGATHVPGGPRPLGAKRILFTTTWVRAHCSVVQRAASCWLWLRDALPKAEVGENGGNCNTFQINAHYVEHVYMASVVPIPFMNRNYIPSMSTKPLVRPTNASSCVVVFICHNTYVCVVLHLCFIAVKVQLGWCLLQIHYGILMYWRELKQTEQFCSNRCVDHYH